MKNFTEADTTALPWTKITDQRPPDDGDTEFLAAYLHADSGEWVMQIVVLDVDCYITDDGRSGLSEMIAPYTHWLPLIPPTVTQA